MKKAFLVTLMAILFCGASYAQGYMVVNTEKIFKSVAAYNNAITAIEDLTAKYQKNIDDAYAGIDKMYNEYQSQKGYLSETVRRSREDAIITREKEVAKYQQDVFGPEGDLMKKRLEMMKPIQDKVFETINSYAEKNGFGLVIDLASNPAIIYYAPASDKTDEIIKLVK